MKSSPLIWCLLSKCQIEGEDFVNFCGFLRKPELFHYGKQWVYLEKSYKMQQMLDTTFWCMYPVVNQRMYPIWVW